MSYRGSITGSTVQSAAQKETISSCVRTKESVEIKIGDKAETNTLPSPFQCFESGAVAFSAGVERRGERAAWRLSSRNTEASTWGRKQRAPRGGPRGDSLHDSLTVLSPPPVHPCVGPQPHCSGGEECHIHIHTPCSPAQPPKKKRKSNPFS